jgi:hypothetical protein
MSKKPAMTAQEQQAVENFNQAVQKAMKGGIPRDKAIAKVARKQPELHRQYLVATNASPAAKTAIENSFKMKAK